jgi:integrase/recombinase XerD
MTEPTRSEAGNAIAVTSERYLRHLAIERGLSANTLAAYRRDLRSYLAFLSERDRSTPDAISEDDVTAFAHSLHADPQRPLAASSVARMLSTVRGLHTFFVDESLASLDVAHSVELGKQSMRLPKAITIEQIALVLSSFAGDDVISLRNTALLELLYATGARVSEVVSLNVDDMIDGDSVRLLGKGNKQRIVPVGSFAQEAIQKYLHSCVVYGRTRGAIVSAERVVDHPGCCGSGEFGDRYLTSYLSALIRDPSALGRG